MILDEFDAFDYSKKSIKQLERYDIAYGCRILLEQNRKNEMYYELYFSHKTACGIFIGAGDCHADTSDTDRRLKKCEKCSCSHCINCYGDTNCLFCSFRMIDALNLMNIQDDKFFVRFILLYSLHSSMKSNII